MCKERFHIKWYVLTSTGYFQKRCLSISIRHNKNPYIDWKLRSSSLRLSKFELVRNISEGNRFRRPDRKRINLKRTRMKHIDLPNFKPAASKLHLQIHLLIIKPCFHNNSNIRLNNF